MAKVRIPSIFQNSRGVSGRKFALDRNSCLQQQFLVQLQLLQFMAASISDLIQKAGIKDQRVISYPQKRIAEYAAVDPAQVVRALESHSSVSESLAHRVGSVLGFNPEYVAQVRERDVLRQELDDIEKAVSQAVAEKYDDEPDVRKQKKARDILRGRVTFLEDSVLNSRPFVVDKANRELVFRKFRRALGMNQRDAASAIVEAYSTGNEGVPLDGETQRLARKFIVMMVGFFEEGRLADRGLSSSSLAALVPLSRWIRAVSAKGNGAGGELTFKNFEVLCDRLSKAIAVPADAGRAVGNTEREIWLCNPVWKDYRHEDANKVFQVDSDAGVGARISIRRDLTTFPSVVVEFIEARQVSSGSRGYVRIVNAKHAGTEAAIVLAGSMYVSCAEKPFVGACEGAGAGIKEGVDGVVHHGKYEVGDLVIFKSSLYHRVEFLDKDNKIAVINFQLQL